MVVIVAVVTRESVATAVGSRGIDVACVPKGDIVSIRVIAGASADTTWTVAVQAVRTGRSRGLVKRAASGVDFMIASNTYL